MSGQSSLWSRSTPRGACVAALALVALLAITTPALASVPFGNVLKLDGSNDYATVADNTSLDIGDAEGEDFTVDVFFYVDNANKAENENDILFSKGTAPRGNVVFRSLSQDTIVFRLNGTTTLINNTDITDGWHHAAFVYDNEYTASEDLFQIYYDGSLFASTSAVEFTPGFAANSSAFDVGALTGAGAWDDGLDEVRVSDVVRYTGSYTVPASAFSSDANTRALWHFGEACGSTSFADSSANANTLTGTNGAQAGVLAPSLCPTTTTLALVKTATDIEASGTVAPAHTGIEMKVALYQDTGGGFVKLDTNGPALDGTSAYATSFPRPGGGGKCKIKATFPGDGDHTKSRDTARIKC